MSDSNLTINTSTIINPESMYGIMNSFAINPFVIGITLLIILIYILIFSFTSKNNNLGMSSSKSSDFFDFNLTGNKESMSNSTGGLFSTSSKDNSGSISTMFDLGLGEKQSNTSSSNLSSIFLFVIFLFLFIFLFFNILQYFFNINITADIKKIFTKNPTVDVLIDQTSYTNPGIILKKRKQVFNIPENKHTYNDAKALCSAYGARLATYDEIEEAYNDGGEWCNYGWSDDQMALFPTQKSTYDKLQNIPGHEHDCGRPGVNGGFIANPEVRFGVNCYGEKPKMTQEEKEIMETQPPYPLTEKDLAFQHRVDYWKNNLANVLVSPFNSMMWSE